MGDRSSERRIRHHRPPALRRRDKLAVAGVAIVGLAVAGAVMMAVMRSRASTVSREGEIKVAQGFVQDQFEATAHFRPMEEVSYKVLDQEDDKVQVSGRVQVVDGQGHLGNYSYSVTMHRNPDGEWVSDEVSVLPF